MTFIVTEIFGPTLQGEGALVGRPTFFVRFGGCDLRCSWCDSMHSVEPSEIAKAPRLTTQEIIDQLTDLQCKGDNYCRHVTLSGGNPCIWDLTNLCYKLRSLGWQISVETQGTIWRSWLLGTTTVTVSPKPPSSHMIFNIEKFLTFCDKFPDSSESSWLMPKCILKVVVFDEFDFAFAEMIARIFRLEHWPMYLSVGTPKLAEDVRTSRVRDILLNRTERIAQWMYQSETMNCRGVAILPQMHVLLWGTQRGV